jgi:hypothetical protein
MFCPGFATFVRQLDAIKAKAQTTGEPVTLGKASIAHPTAFDLSVTPPWTI